MTIHLIILSKNMNICDDVHKYQSHTDNITKMIISMSAFAGHSILLIPKVITLHFCVFRLYIFNRRVIKTFKKDMAECHERCDHDGACLGSLKEYANNIRQGLSMSVKKLEKTISLNKIPYALLSALLVDWDDILEDCIISTDPKIRSAIHRIADLC